MYIHIYVYICIYIYGLVARRPALLLLLLAAAAAYYLPTPTILPLRAVRATLRRLRYLIG